MKRSIKRIISFALVMTMLLSTMLVVSAEGTNVAESFSVEEELMPMAATNCIPTSAKGYSGKTYSYSYSSTNVRLHKGADNKSGLRSSESESFINNVIGMANIYNNELSDYEKSVWPLFRHLEPTIISVLPYGIDQIGLMKFQLWQNLEESAENDYADFRGN